MTEHTILAFDADLQGLRLQVEKMAVAVQQQIALVTRALTDADAAAAKRVIEREDHINSFQREIEHTCIETIVRRQPFAIDLREIVCAFRIVGDLERIGDLARNIGTRVLAMDVVPPAPLLAGFRRLSGLASDRLVRVLKCYAERDDVDTLIIWESDAEIDDMHGSLFRELLTHMFEDPRNIPTCTHLLFCSKNMERIGDHATNIAESVHYMLTGKIFENNRPKGTDTTAGLVPGMS
jgi:phosphate transport system protein